MLVQTLLTRPPNLHGAAGYWDEVINLLPVLLGSLLLLYLYFSSRKQKPAAKPEKKRGEPGEPV
jgi:hypothetical protein